MLAYVFSHRPGPDVDVAEYEATLRHFHDALAGVPPQGFLGSSTFRVGDRYSDWYLVENSAALDVLNEAAVSGARTSPHNAAARMAVDGEGKLLSRAGGDQRPGSGFEIRFSKPSGMSYQELYDRMQPFSSRSDSSLWRRMMVLGPPPEFCLIAASELELPPEFRPEVLRREPI